MGTSLFAFTGGEPIMSKELPEYIKTVEEGDGCATIFTTGFGISEKKAAELKEAGLCYATISLDHFDPATVDRLRGYKGAHKAAIEAIENCQG